MSVAAQQRGPGSDWTEVTLTYDFELEPRLALAWLGELASRPLTGTPPAEYVAILSCYQALATSAPDAARDALPLQLPARGRALVQSAMREALQRDPTWMQVDASGGYTANVGPSSRLEQAWHRLPDEIWQALTAPTNIAGTIAQSLLLLDALVRSVPVSWIAKVQGGHWELIDANAQARRHAFGKTAKAALKPRMVLRARNVRLPWKVPGAYMRSGAARVAAPGATTVKEGLKIARAGSMRWISKAAHSSLPIRGALGSNLVGAALSLVPQAVADASESGLFDNANVSRNWSAFAVAEAKGQSGNVAGIIGGMALGAVAVWVGVSAAPALIVVGLVGGAVSQAGFNALGLNEDAAAGMRWLLDKVAKV